jgi:hypothetical protein
MGTGYLRQSAGDIVDTAVIEASHFNAEFQRLLQAFSDSTGHSHNGGTDSEGGPITVVGPTQDVVISDVRVTPKTTNTVDVGSSSLKFKDLYLSGDIQDANVDLTNVTLTGTTAQFNTALSDDDFATLTNTVTLTNKTLTAPVISSIVNIGTLTLPTSTDTLVGRDTTDTLTNKTLTAPVITTISNTGTITLPTSTDTLVGRATADTLTNKTINSADNTITIDFSVSGWQIDGTNVDVTATELNYLNIATLGTGEASKAVTASATNAVTLTGDLKTTSYLETHSTLTGTSPSIDCSAANTFSITLTGDSTLSFSNVPSGSSYSCLFKVVQGTTDYTITWPSAVKWQDNIEPSLTSGSGAVDIFILFTHDGGTNWYGFVAGQDMS